MCRVARGTKHTIENGRGKGFGEGLPGAEGIRGGAMSGAESLGLYRLTTYRLRLLL